MMSRFLLILFCSMMSWNSVAQYAPALLVLKNASIIDANHKTPSDPQSIVISNGRIVSISSPSGLNIPDSAVVIDLKGKYILPGLIDSHVHFATDPSGIDNRPHTLQVLEQMLYAGVTTVRDMAGDARTLASLSRDAAVGDIIAPDIYYSALMAGPTFFDDPRTVVSSKNGRSGGMPYMTAVSDTTNLLLTVAQAKGTGASGIKLYADLSAKLATRIITESKKQHIPVWAHARLKGLKPSDLVNAGVISISHAPLLIYEKMEKVPDNWKTGKFTKDAWDKMVPDLNDLFLLMKKNHVIFDATLLTYKDWAENDTTMRWDYEIGRRITARAYAAGVSICAGVDLDQKQFVQDEMIVLVKEVGFKSIDAIIAGTKNSAAAIAVDSSRGTIAEGMNADLLILNKNPLDDISNIKEVYFVVKGGKIFKR